MPESSTESSATESLPPVVVDLGKVKRKRIRQLKQGRGPLLDEVDHVVDTVRRNLGDDEAKEILPVVILYRRRPKKKRGLWW